MFCINFSIENNYENFAHELSNSYWSPMTNTRDLASNPQDRKLDNGSSRLQVQVDLNSTNSDSQSQRSSVTEMTTPNPNAGMASSLGNS